MLENEFDEDGFTEFIRGTFAKMLLGPPKDIQYVEDKGILYEIGQNGEKTIVRSTSSEKRAYVRFTNRISRPVDVWWRDYRGIKHHYICLGPGAFTDINTFIEHPWQFTDPSTNENYVINNAIIFRAPEKLANMMFRVNWNITVAVRSLRYSAMLALATKMNAPCCVKHLGLPKKLEEELFKMVQNVLMEEPRSERPNADDPPT